MQSLMGRIVRYVDDQNRERAAIVIGTCAELGMNVPDTIVNLHVFYDGGNDLGANATNLAYYWKSSVPYSEKPAMNTWHWPKIDEAKKKMIPVWTVVTAIFIIALIWSFRSSGVYDITPIIELILK